jgi:hypothetical protein
LRAPLHLWSQYYALRNAGKTWKEIFDKTKIPIMTAYDIVQKAVETGSVVDQRSGPPTVEKHIHALIKAHADTAKEMANKLVGKFGQAYASSELVIGRPRIPSKFSVGGFSFKGKTKLSVWSGRQPSQHYVDTLEGFILPFASGCVGKK